MGHLGRRNSFLDHWHDRQLVLPDGRRLLWVAMLGYDPPLAECFRVDGLPVAPDEAARLLAAAGHPDAELVQLDTPLGAGAFH